MLARQNGPTVVAGHSYGGQIITALGTDTPNVVGLVYIAGLRARRGRVDRRAARSRDRRRPALAHLDVDQQGFAWLPEDDFVGHFAADVDPVKARVMYAVQQPLHLSTLDEVMGAPAWKSLPSWFLVADGRRGDPARCRAAVRRAHGRHHRRGLDQPLAMVSHPDEVYSSSRRPPGRCATSQLRSASSELAQSIHDAARGWRPPFKAAP